MVPRSHAGHNKYDEYCERAVAYLRCVGQPVKAHVIGSSCNIPKGSLYYILKNSAFIKTGKGANAVIWLADKTVEAATTDPPGPNEWTTAVHKVLLLGQPLTLAELSIKARIPQADLFKLLASNTQFERDTSRMYWLAAKAKTEADIIEDRRYCKRIIMNRWHTQKQARVATE